ncbi:TPA: hypothetical protein ACF2DE_002876 [Clostridium perfringens]
MEERKITSIRLIDSESIEVEITKIIKEKVILNQDQLLNLTSGNQMKSSINSKDSIIGEIKSNYPKATYSKCDDVATKELNDKLNVKKIRPFEVEIKTGRPLNKDELKKLSKQLQDDINKHAKIGFTNWV